MQSEEYERIATKYLNTVYRVAVSYTASHDDAEDIAQTTFLRLFQTSTEFQDDEHIRRWLIHVAINECKRMWTSAWYKKVSITEEYKEIIEQPQPEYEVLWEAIFSLPAKLRVVVHLYYFEGYRSKEIADILHIRDATVRNRLSRARKLLKEFLKEGEEAYE